MKSFTILESAIIGFFVGVVVSAYLIFLTSTGGFIGQIIDWLSMGPILNLLHLPESSKLLYSFLFYILVYTIYGVVVGLLIKDSRKITVITSIIILGLFVSSAFEQSHGVPQIISDTDASQFQVASVVQSIPRINKEIDDSPKQYFGNEVSGDLNSDGVNDIAFIITRNDKERGMLYYLSTALGTSTGHIGTNLIYLGEKLNPQRIYIDNGIIGFEYLDSTQKKMKDMSTSTIKTIFSQVKNGILEQVITDKEIK